MSEGSKGTVLVIDDTEKILKIVTYFLETEGYTVIQADNPFDGIASAVQHKLDLIILDIMMPKMDGYEVYAELRERGITERTPVVMLTAKAVIKHTPKNFFFGLYGFLEKPFTRAELLELVDEVHRVTHETPFQSAGETRLITRPSLREKPPEHE
jgi:DNA-binding response OmpR family regulator